MGLPSIHSSKKDVLGSTVLGRLLGTAEKSRAEEASPQLKFRPGEEPHTPRIGSPGFQNGHWVSHNERENTTFSGVNRLRPGTPGKYSEAIRAEYILLADEVAHSRPLSGARAAKCRNWELCRSTPIASFRLDVSQPGRRVPIRLRVEAFSAHIVHLSRRTSTIVVC